MFGEGLQNLFEKYMKYYQPIWGSAEDQSLKVLRVVRSPLAYLKYRSDTILTSVIFKRHLGPHFVLVFK